MVGTGLVLAMLQLTQVASAEVTCDFPGDGPGQKPIHLTIESKRSLTDKPGFYRVDMALNGKINLKAAARPIVETKERDVIVLGKSDKRDIYTLGVRDDGQAAFSIRLAMENGGFGTEATRLGECRGIGPLLDYWLNL